MLLDLQQCNHAEAGLQRLVVHIEPARERQASTPGYATSTGDLYRYWSLQILILFATSVPLPLTAVTRTAAVTFTAAARILTAAAALLLSLLLLLRILVLRVTTATDTNHPI